MQFLPSFYADLPSTPGITAVATLAYHSLSNPSIIVSDVALPLLPNHVLNQVPVEVWQLIANKIPPMDLRGCAPILGAQFFAAAHDILRHSHIGNHRLVDVGEVEDSTPCTAKGGNFENINPVLVKRRFSVMRRGPSSVCSVVICGQKYAQKGKRDFQVSLGKYSDPDFIRYSIQGGRRRRWRRLQGGSGKGGWHGSRRGRPSMDDPDGNASVSS
ncbi:hypothetical protein C8J57DRAFT_573253 [Mycena rebaudengoi]|nr:hypothetical protein C8J57DRAFT_573253 [Mycena rebaudengoi]